MKASGGRNKKLTSGNVKKKIFNIRVATKILHRELRWQRPTQMQHHK